MAIEAINQSLRVTYNSFPAESFSNVVKNLNKVALPTIALMALSNVPGVDGGPMGYGICVSYCLAFASPIFMPACILACLPILQAPTP